MQFRSGHLVHARDHPGKPIVVSHYDRQLRIRVQIHDPSTVGLQQIPKVCWVERSWQPDRAADERAAVQLAAKLNTAGMIHEQYDQHALVILLSHSE